MISRTPIRVVPILGLTLLILVGCVEKSPEPVFVKGPAVVPLPVKMSLGSGSFELDGKTDSKLHGNVSVMASPQLPGAVSATRLLLSGATGFTFGEAPDSERADMRFTLAPELPPEGYRLKVGANGIHIEAPDEAGAFYALQTLRQLMPVAIYSSSPVSARWVMPYVEIEDSPRFAWRGLHLDVGRHFMPVEFIKKYIDLLALHKMNTFHWHLTEDQGWRIEIKQYPRLTEVGSRRAQTVIGNVLFKDPEELEYDGVPHGGFYTQEEVKEVVAYAAARHVTVVPEVEFPGHVQAAIAAYPELGNTGEPVQVKEEWGISLHTLNPSDETLQFYRNVFTEIMALFPSRYIHIGGDEAPKDQWRDSTFAQSRMQTLGLEDENALQSWMIGQLNLFLRENGRQLVGWDEIMQGGLPEGAVVMSWRGAKPGMQAAEAGHSVVMAPVEWTYFDYYQADSDNEPLAIGSYTPLLQAYGYDPAPDTLSADVRSRILGAQGQLWTEFMKTPDHVEYMAYPRAVALAEVVWTPQDERDYAQFLGRLSRHLERLDKLGVNYRPPGGDELDLASQISEWFWGKALMFYFWSQDAG